MTKKVSKAKTILRAFTQTSNIDPTLLEQRREACKTCPRNSMNVDVTTMGLKDRMQHTLAKPFCTICKCFIAEKTSQETEECALTEIGEQPLWTRLKLETTGSTDLNMINKSPDKINVDMDEETGEYIIGYKPINISSDTNIRFSLEKDGLPITVNQMIVNCSCLKLVKEANPQTDSCTLFLSLDLSNRPTGELVGKYFEVYYVLNGKADFIKVRAKATITE